MNQKLVRGPSGEYEWVDANKARKAPPRAVDTPVMGESLGCIGTQVEEMRAAAKADGFSDIDYVPDPEIEGWYDCKAPNAKRHAEWAKVCGVQDKNGQFSGKTITRDELSTAERRVRQQYPLKDGK